MGAASRLYIIHRQLDIMTRRRRRRSKTRRRKRSKRRKRRRRRRRRRRYMQRPRNEILSASNASFPAHLSHLLSPTFNKPSLVKNSQSSLVKMSFVTTARLYLSLRWRQRDNTRAVFPLSNESEH